jgi:cytochrome c-type biogenesis protein CcmH/NrfG
MGDFYFERGEYDSAIGEYQRGVELDPANQTLRAKIERARKAKAAEERLNQ